MTFDTAEAMVEFYEQNKDKYGLSTGSSGFTLYLKGRPWEVIASIKDERAGILAMRRLDSMIQFTS